MQSAPPVKDALGLNGQGHGGDGVEQSLHGGTGGGLEKRDYEKKWPLALEI
jgi:hypothetical protein